MTQPLTSDTLRERVRDYIYDCTRDEFNHGWTLSAHQTDDLIAMVRSLPIDRSGREIQDMGVPASPSGHSAEPEPICVVSAVPASVPNAEDGEYRMTPHFRRFLGVVGSVDRALAAWDIAEEAFGSNADEAEFGVWQGDQMVAGCSGPRGRALAEAVHYAVVYQTADAPCEVQEVIRRVIDPEVAHSIIAASGTETGTDETEGLGPKGDGPTAEGGDAHTQGRSSETPNTGEGE